MPILVAAVVLVGVICCLDLVLTLGIIRRLRDHSERLSAAPAAVHEGPDDLILEPGAAVGAFTAVTTEGETVGRDQLAAPTLVGFFTPHCEPCRERAPQFAELARAMPSGRTQVIAVIVDDQDAHEELDELFRATAQIVVERGRDGAMSKAFDVKGYPAMALVDAQGAVLTSGYKVEPLAAALVH